mmetsp:Transcript_2824/g.5855  ORF Transcript_2824/g.5855 Transcript_2824/m.5855 type:complete len:347 (-) Transcript_2824:266-1306(-)
MPSQCAECQSAGAKKHFLCEDCPANGGVTQKFYVCDPTCQKAFWKAHRKTHTDPPSADVSSSQPSLDEEIRRKMANEMVDKLDEAMIRDEYPDISTEGIFGVRMNQGPNVGVQSPFGGRHDPMKLGDVVFNAWITLLRNGQLRKGEIVEALLKGRLPAWYEEKVRNDNRPLSFYSLALVEGNLFGQIDWDQTIHNALKAGGQKSAVSASSSSSSSSSQKGEASGSTPAGASTSSERFKSHLKLSKTELRALVKKALGKEDERMVERIERAFETVGRDVAAVIDFNKSRGSPTHDYVWKRFGPDSKKSDQEWWIENVGLWGGPDDVLKGEELHLARDPKEKIIRLLR